MTHTSGSETQAAPPKHHPLDPLSREEITAAVVILTEAGRVPEGTWFSDIGLVEPTRDELAAYTAGHPVERRVRVVLVHGPDPDVLETVVSLDTNAVLDATTVVGVHPTILIEESYVAAEALRAHPDWLAAMERRGITDLDTVEIDPWPAGRFGLAIEEHCRLARCTAYVKNSANDNMYARPVDGVVAFVDTGRRQVIAVEDHGVEDVPPAGGEYLAEQIGSFRGGLRPIEISQPEGPSFSVDGHRLVWQRWSMRLSMNAHEGLVLHTVAYEDESRERPILFRASINEMVVPYGTSSPMHAWKNAFDASEWGLGKAANSLSLGCDCLGEVHYLDAIFANERGVPYRVRNAVCIHEEDAGVAWRHTDLSTGANEVRRGRRLVVSFFATAGNYDYGFFWYFYLDGTIECEVKLTGIVSTEVAPPGRRLTHATRVTEQLAAPNHQHLFNARLHFEVDGPGNCLVQSEVVTDEPGSENPLGGAFQARSVLLVSELEAQRTVDPAASRVWKIENRHSLNAWGDPVAYKLAPGSTPTLMAQPDSSVARRAAFATKNLWATPYRPDERRAAGEYPNQHIGGDGLPRWTAANRSLVDADLVCWYTFGVTHIPRPEDYPVMPVERTGFSLVPFGFFDRNPALDLPPPKACH